MSEEQKAVIDCPQCGKKIRVPTNRGKIKFTCPVCKTVSDWAPPATAVEVEPVIEDVVFEKPTSRWKIQDKEGKSTFDYLTSIVVYVAFIAGIVWFFGNTEIVAIVNTLFGIAIIYALYKAIKVFSGKDTGAAVGLTFTALLVFGTLPGLIINIIPEGGMNFDLSGLSVLSEPVMEDSHFKDVNVENTTPSDLDDLMEGWE